MLASLKIPFVLQDIRTPLAYEFLKFSIRIYMKIRLVFMPKAGASNPWSVKDFIPKSILQEYS